MKIFYKGIATRFAPCTSRKGAPPHTGQKLQATEIATSLRLAAPFLAMTQLGCDAFCKVFSCYNSTRITQDITLQCALFCANGEAPHGKCTPLSRRPSLLGHCEECHRRWHDVAISVAQNFCPAHIGALPQKVISVFFAKYKI